MSKLIYSTIMSLDGYVADESGTFDWAMPDEEVFSFVNDLERRVGIYLYGRRMYETMVYWETATPDTSSSPPAKDFTQIWQAAEKVVYSRTLKSAYSARTRIERDFTADAVRQLKQTESRPITVGGPELAAQAMGAGLVDELQLFVVPVMVGGGKSSLPARLRIPLHLLDERCFGNGTVYMHYRVTI